MASVRKVSVRPERWEVHLASQSKSEVAVEVNMSKEMAEKLANLETSRMAELNPDADLEPEDVGSAVLNILGIHAANGRI